MSYMYDVMRRQVRMRRGTRVLPLAAVTGTGTGTGTGPGTGTGTGQSAEATVSSTRG